MVRKLGFLPWIYEFPSHKLIHSYRSHPNIPEQECLVEGGRVPSTEGARRGSIGKNLWSTIRKKIIEMTGADQAGEDGCAALDIDADEVFGGAVGAELAPEAILVRGIDAPGPKAGRHLCLRAAHNNRLLAPGIGKDLPVDEVGEVSASAENETDSAVIRLSIDP